MEESNNRKGKEERNRSNHRGGRNPQQHKDRLQNLSEKWFAHPTEAKTRQGNSELAGRQICVEITRHRLRLGSADTSLVRQRFKLTHADFDQSELCRYEETV